MEENKSVKTEKAAQDKGMSQILPGEKRSWWSVAFIWIGTMICIPMLMVGGMFGGALTLGTTFIVTVIGFAICCFLMVMGGIIGSDLGLNATMTSTRAFGMTGANFSMALVVFIAEAGWFAVQTATCALAANTLMALFGVDGAGSGCPVSSGAHSWPSPPSTASNGWHGSIISPCRCW